jgi:demethylphylloquinol methyltransferase
MTEIQQLFNRIAPNYDRLNDWLSLGQHRIWKKMAIKWCAPQPGQRYLDLCCGSGDLALLLAPSLYPDGRVVGIDFAQETLAIATQRTYSLPRYLQSSINWQLGDVLALNLEDNSFDGAIMAYGLRNVVDIPKCLKELQRVLKPGATAAILDFHRPDSELAANFQAWYLANVVVRLAESLNIGAEYAYISPSLARFPQGKEQEKLAIAAGFSQAKHYPFVGGMMGILLLKA